MNLKLTLEIITSIGTLGAVIVAMLAIHKTDKNNREQIITNKLEELLELIKYLGKYYMSLKELDIEIENLRNPDFKELQTLSEYYKIRDIKLPIHEREKIFDKLSRLEVLAKCYTKDDLKEDILKFESLIYTMTEFASKGGSLQKTLNWKNGFPTYTSFHETLINLEKKIVKQITVKK